MWMDREPKTETKRIRKGKTTWNTVKCIATEGGRLICRSGYIYFDTSQIPGFEYIEQKCHEHRSRMSTWIPIAGHCAPPPKKVQTTSGRNKAGDLQGEDVVLSFRHCHPTCHALYTLTYPNFKDAAPLGWRHFFLTPQSNSHCPPYVGYIFTDVLGGEKGIT